MIDYTRRENWKPVAQWLSGTGAFWTLRGKEWFNVHYSHRSDSTKTVLDVSHNVVNGSDEWGETYETLGEYWVELHFNGIVKVTAKSERFAHVGGSHST